MKDENFNEKMKSGEKDSCFTFIEFLEHYKGPNYAIVVKKKGF